jgi:dimeric dUTPase (all-alpha-NTP-PPase superfamily)
MNFTKIAEMQKTLDESYSKNGFFNNQYIEQKRLVAILVEIGEFANEYAPFKY